MDRDWRCQKYGPLGYMETFVKILGVGVAIASLSVFNNGDRQLLSTRIAQIVLLSIIGALYLAMIVQRIFDKELFALAFIALHVIGHWLMVLVTILSIDPGAFLFTYCFLMVLGEYIKIMFLFLAENVEVRWLTKPILFGVSAFLVVVYLVIIILQIVSWLVDYTSAT